MGNQRAEQKELIRSQQSETYFAIVLERGEHWDASRPMCQQEQWEEHMAFLDALSDDGLILEGGPLGERGTNSSSSLPPKISTRPSHASQAIHGRV
jgi:hypothetical protein